MDLLITIALLCQASGSSQWWWNHDYQLKCQKYYIECVGDQPSAGKLAECVLKKK